MLNDHGCSHDERSDIDWVLCGKVLDPKEEGSMSHLNRVLKGIIKSNKDWDLDHHWEASAHGVDFSSFVKQHDLLLKPCLVIFILLFKPAHLRLYFLHLLHRFETDLCEGQEDDFDQDAYDDNIDSVIPCYRVCQVQEPEDGFGNN